MESCDSIMLMRPDSGARCYHCGEPVPAGTSWTATIDREEQPMCCPGCQAVAQLISGSGLASFYKLRTSLNERAAPVPEQNPYEVYDYPANNGDFVSELEGGRSRAQLLLGGVSCAACTWLIEKALLANDAVFEANVNLARQSLTVEFEKSRLPVSDIFCQLLALGYDPHPWQLTEGARLLEREQRSALRELAVAGIAMMQVGMFAIALHAGEIQGIALEYRSLMRWVSLIIATVVVFYSARSFFRNAWVNLRHGRLVMDVPVALAIGLAYVASAWATLHNTGEVYFDSIAMFAFFLLLGRFLERQVRRREFLRQTDLQSLLPAACTRRGADGWETVPTRSVTTGDILLLRAGDVIAADGEILAGGGAVDEAAFTGENMPRSFSSGDLVSAGTLLREGGGELRVLADSAGSRLATMLLLLSRAGGQKPALAQFADRVAARFVAVVLLVAAGVAAYWWLEAPEQALWVTLSVLVVSCPCALALATPTALTAATSRLRRRGLLTTGENTLESLLACDRVIFDKTGTLTLGRLQLRATVPAPGVDEADVLAIAAALETHGNHPIATAFEDVEPHPDLAHVNVVPGRGIRAMLDGSRVAIGSPRFVGETCATVGNSPQREGHWIVLASEQGPLAWFALEDSPRPGAAEAVHALQQRGLVTELLTGDPSEAGPALARELGLDAERHGVSPEAKLEHIRDLQARGSRVAVVGDGLNDAPVLAAADCAFAVNQATDLAKSRADAILLSTSLAPVDYAFQVARRTRSVIRQNMGWALAYNTCAVPLAAMGLVPPWAAAIGMSASSLLVVLNSLRLK
jgi:Cu2+-exporting ATPase